MDFDFEATVGNLPYPSRMNKGFYILLNLVTSWLRLKAYFITKIDMA